MDIKIIKDKISSEELQGLAKENFGDMIKAVVDVEKKIVAVGGELHADAESLLLKDGSKQSHLWGINIYPFKKKTEMIEYTSLINIRPAQNNCLMEIEDEKLKEVIRDIIVSLII